MCDARGHDVHSNTPHKTVTEEARGASFGRPLRGWADLSAQGASDGQVQACPSRAVQVCRLYWQHKAPRDAPLLRLRWELVRRRDATIDQGCEESCNHWLRILLPRREESQIVEFLLACQARRLQVVQVGAPERALRQNHPRILGHGRLRSLWSLLPCSAERAGAKWLPAWLPSSFLSSFDVERGAQPGES